MSTKNLHRAPRTLLHAATHPLSTLSFGVGMVRGLAAGILRAASGAGGPAHAEWVAPPEPVTEEEAGAEHVEAQNQDTDLQLGENLEPAPERAPADPGEAFATEPSAVSRISAHGGGGADEQIDEWYDQVEDDELPSGVVEALEFGDTLPNGSPRTTSG